ncbi:hypothetical protein Mal64_35760 [Pseudobythopirellula maris]|uniref:Uncharacterized protein n=1 Tax=Pseudobythopirellula maris TaxID=2527991 RepID=A0A5C5ZHP8_9BACT|nr:hypothetical protein [Pseudobythopirellula maris]TWT86746.1 hypothetical protein Mal64_35760 [Pseudobythopirellula maris]
MTTSPGQPPEASLPPAQGAAVPPGDTAPSKAGLIQLLLDPRSLQTLMIAGGSLLTLGLVIWLVVIGVFNEPLHAALGLGAANLGLLVAGVAVADRTRYRIAGRGVAMLASLLLPLNLWFYDAQGLISLEGGGHLWLPALACCVAYAVVARVLKDSLFVYAFVGGVAMTGMLFLADAHVGHFWEVMAPSTLLVVLGAACVHAERLFPELTPREEDVAFTRGDFGLAFFRAGHAAMGAGLGLLLGGRLAGRFYETLFDGRGWFEVPDVATVGAAQLTAFGLALVGAYTYAYSRFALGGRRFLLFSMLSLFWSLVIGVDLLGIEFTESLFVGMLAVVSVGCYAATRLYASPRGETTEESANYVAADEAETLAPALRATGAACANVALVLVLLQLMRGLFVPEGGLLAFHLGLGYCLAGAATLAAQLLKAVDSKTEGPAGGRASVDRLVGPAFAAAMLVSGLAAVLPFAAVSGAGLVALQAAVPLALLAWGYTSVKQRDEAVFAAEGGAILMTTLTAPLLLAGPSVGVAVLAAATAAVFAIASTMSPRRAPALLAPVMTALAAWQLIAVYELGVHGPLLVASLLGVAAIAVDAFRPTGRLGVAGLGLTVLAAVGGALLAANRLVADEASAGLLGLLVSQAAIGFVGSWLTKDRRGRHLLLLSGGLGVIMAALTLNAVSVLSGVQRFELLVASVGAAILAAGHVGWWRENLGDPTQKRPTGVDLNLWIGSLLTSVPLCLGLLASRLMGDGLGEVWSALHNGGVVLVALAMLASGVLCRLRATSLTGGAMMALYLVSLVFLLHVPDELQNVAVYLMAGGAGLFGGAVLLSVYRDRLMELPGRIREGEGVFAVLKWR